MIEAKFQFNEKPYAASAEIDEKSGSYKDLAINGVPVKPSSHSAELSDAAAEAISQEILARKNVTVSPKKTITAEESARIENEKATAAKQPAAKAPAAQAAVPSA